MAKVKIELPTEIIKDVEMLEKNSDQIFGGATQAAAEVVASKIKSSAPVSELSSHVKVTKFYKTPSDGGINSKVYFTGYLPFRNGQTSFSRRGGKSGKVYTTTKGIPAAFIANMFEYGARNRYTTSGAYRGSVNKRPFIRKAFNRAELNAIIEKKIKELSGGVIDE